MDILKGLLDLLGALQAWATEPAGFFALVLMGVALWSGWQLVKHLRENVKARRSALQAQIDELKEELRNVRFDFETTKLEYASDLSVDASHFESLRVLYVELRGLFLSKLGGQRQTPPEFNDIEQRYQVLRKDRHDEKSRRLERHAQAIERARERLAREVRESA